MIKDIWGSVFSGYYSIVGTLLWPILLFLVSELYRKALKLLNCSLSATFQFSCEVPSSSNSNVFKIFILTTNKIIGKVSVTALCCYSLRNERLNSEIWEYFKQNKISLLVTSIQILASSIQKNIHTIRSVSSSSKIKL